MADLLQKHGWDTTRALVEAGAQNRELTLNDGSGETTKNGPELIISNEAGTTFYHFASLERFDDTTENNSGASLIGVDDSGFSVISGSDLQNLLTNIDVNINNLGSSNAVLLTGNQTVEGIKTWQDNAIFDAEVQLTKGAQDYKLTDHGNTLALQGVSGSSVSYLSIFSNDGDGTDDLGILLFAVGQPNSVANQESFALAYDESAGRYILRSQQAGTGAVNPISIHTEGYEEQLIISPDGNVGINTSSPSRLLHVVGSGNAVPTFTAGTYAAFQSNNIPSYGVGISILGGNQGNSFIDFSDADDADAGQINYNHLNDSMNFRVNAQSVLTLDASQNASFSGDIVQNNGLIRGAQGILSNTYIQFGIDEDNNSVNSYFNWRTNGSDSLMLLNEEGLLGIGTTTPAGKLDVNGSVYFSPNTEGKRTFQFVSQGLDEGKLKILNDVTETIVLNTNGDSWLGGGNVGIGTTSPERILHVSYTSGVLIRITNEDTSLVADQIIGSFEFEKKDASGAGAGVAGSISLRTEGSIGESTFMAFNVSSSTVNDFEAVRINSLGDVGIGTVSPNFGGYNQKCLTVTGAQGGVIQVGGDKYANSSYIYKPVDGNLAIGTIADVAILFNPGNTEKMRINYDGTLDIGQTRSSATKVTVNGAVGTASGSAARPAHTFYGDNDTGMYRPFANHLYFATGGVAALALDSSQNAVFYGNVGLSGNNITRLGGLLSDGDLVFGIDENNNNTTGHRFAWRNNGSAVLMSLWEGGKLQLHGIEDSLNTTGQFIRTTSSGDFAFDCQGGFIINLDANNNDTSGTFRIRANGSATNIFEVTQDGYFNTTKVGVDRGTEALPTLAFSADLNTGIFSPAENTIALTTGGVEGLRLSSGQNVSIYNTLYNGAGALPALSADTKAVFYNSGVSGDDINISLISGNAGHTQISFGDTDDEDESYIRKLNYNDYGLHINAGIRDLYLEGEDIYLVKNGSQILTITDFESENSVDFQNANYFNFTLADNTSGAFRIAQGSNEYFQVNTTNTSEEVIIGNTTTNPNIIFRGQVDFGDVITFTGTGTDTKQQLPSLRRNTNTQLHLDSPGDIVANINTNDDGNDQLYIIDGASTTVANISLAGGAIFNGTGNTIFTLQSTGDDVFTVDTGIGVIDARSFDFDIRSNLNFYGSDSSINTNRESIRRNASNEIQIDGRDDIVINIDTDNNGTDNKFAVRMNASSSDLMSVGDVGFRLNTPAVSTPLRMERDGTTFMLVTHTGGSPSMLVTLGADLELSGGLIVNDPIDLYDDLNVYGSINTNYYYDKQVTYLTTKYFAGGSTTVLDSQAGESVDLDGFTDQSGLQGTYTQTLSKKFKLSTDLALKPDATSTVEVIIYRNSTTLRRQIINLPSGEYTTVSLSTIATLSQNDTFDVRLYSYNNANIEYSLSTLMVTSVQ